MNFQQSQFWSQRCDKEERARYNFWHGRTLNAQNLTETAPSHSPASSDQEGIKATIPRTKPIAVEKSVTEKPTRANGTGGITLQSTIKTSKGHERIHQLEADLKVEEKKGSELRREYRKMHNMHGRCISDATRTIRELVKNS